MRNTTLCHIEKDGKYLMLHRVKKQNDLNHDKWETEYMHIFWSDDFSGEIKACDEGDLCWIPKEDVYNLPIWEGDKIFLRLMDENTPFFSLKLEYVGDTLIKAVLNGEQIK